MNNLYFFSRLQNTRQQEIDTNMLKDYDEIMWTDNVSWSGVLSMEVFIVALLNVRNATSHVYSV